jgi:hypothetical protein
MASDKESASSLFFSFDEYHSPSEVRTHKSWVAFFGRPSLTELLPTFADNIPQSVFWFKWSALMPYDARMTRTYYLLKISGCWALNFAIRTWKCLDAGKGVAIARAAVVPSLGSTYSLPEVRFPNILLRQQVPRHRGIKHEESNIVELLGLG